MKTFFVRSDAAFLQLSTILRYFINHFVKQLLIFGSDETRNLMIRGVLSILLFVSFSFALIGQETEAQAAHDALKLGQHLLGEDDYIAAGEQFELALPYFQKEYDWYQVAYLNLWIGEAAYAEGNYTRALDVTKESLEAAQKIRIPDTLAFYSLIYQNLGVFYSALGDFENQLKHYELSFQKALKLHGRTSQQAADAYFSLGVAYGRRGDWNRCINYTDTSLQISKMVDYQGGVSSAYLNLAHAFAVKEDFASAIDFQTQAINLSDNKAELARGFNNLGMYYNDLGEDKLALENLGKALEIRQDIYPKYHDNILSTLLNFARVYYDMGDLDQSEYYVDLAINNALEASEQNRGYLKIAYNYKAIGLFQREEYEAALSFFEKAKNVDGRQLKVDANVALVGATIYLGMENYEAALNAIQSALATKIPKFTPRNYYDNPGIQDIEDIGMGLDLLEKKAEILYKRAIAKNDIKDLEVALVVYQMLDALIIKSRNTYLNKKSKELLSANAHKLYAGAIAVLYELYQQSNDPVYFDLALAYSEKNKSLSLTEKLNDLYVTSFAQIPQELVQEERQLLQDIEFYANQMINYGTDQDMLRKWEKITFAKRQKRASLLQKIKAEYPQYYDLRYNFDMPSTQDIRKDLLGKEEVFLEYFATEDHLTIFLVSDEERIFLRKPLANKLSQSIESWRTALLSQSDEFYALGNELYQVLLGHLEKKIEGRKLFIVPDGVIGYLPFEALITEPISSDLYDKHRSIPYLIRENLIRYSFSANATLTNQKRQLKKDLKAIMALAPLISGNSEIAANNLNTEREGIDLSPLDGSKEELNRLKTHFSGDFLAGTNASESIFKENAGNYSLLHIATHTLIDDRFPGLSKMVFSGSDTLQDDFLHAYELYNMQLNANLVTLSSCNTGYGQLKKGEGVKSVASAFAYAGCPNMVMSLWPVKDQTTPEIMDRFYQNMANGTTKDLALQQAKIDFIDNYKALYSHPYFWASFIYLGDDQALGLKSESTAFPIWFGLIALVFILIAVAFRRRKVTI